jgi:hypothetical protein
VYNYNSLMTEVLSKSGYVGLLPKASVQGLMFIGPQMAHSSRTILNGV